MKLISLLIEEREWYDKNGRPKNHPESFKKKLVMFGMKTKNITGLDPKNVHTTANDIVGQVYYGGNLEANMQAIYGDDPKIVAAIKKELPKLVAAIKKDHKFEDSHSTSPGY